VHGGFFLRERAFGCSSSHHMFEGSTYRNRHLDIHAWNLTDMSIHPDRGNILPIPTSIPHDDVAATNRRASVRFHLLATLPIVCRISQPLTITGLYIKF
jgi:hypothetical protein